MKPDAQQNSKSVDDRPSLTPSYFPASRETSPVMTNVPSPEPHLGWFWRGYVPHWDHPGMMQAVTFRLHDSVPREVVERWRLELGLDRGRSGVVSATPPSEPDGRISRIRLSSQWGLCETNHKHKSRVPD